MRYNLLLLLLTGTSAWSQLERPQVAWLLDSQNELRAILGTPATASIGDPIAEGVLSVACFPDICFAKTENAVYSSLGWATEAPEGPALFATTENIAYIYFYGTQQVAKWDGTAIIMLPFSAAGELLSLRATSDGFDYAVGRDSGTWIEHYSERTSEVTSIAALGDTGAILLWSKNLALVSSENRLKLVQIDSGGITRSDALGLPNVDSLLPVGNEYVQINAKQDTWLFRLSGICEAEDCDHIAKYELNVLPPVPPRLADNKASDPESTANSSESEERQ